MGSADPWYVEAFRAPYLSVYAHRDLAAARTEVEFLMSEGVRGRVLDLACGFGRHTLALREKGALACGIDLSADLLEHAARTPPYSALRGSLARADMRKLPFQNAVFDSLVCLFSSFGYLAPAEDAGVLREMARVLVPRGIAVLDLMNPAHVRTSLVESSRTERGGHVVDERRWLEDDGRRVHKQVTLREPGGRERRWHESVRLYESSEIESLLRAAGLSLVRSFGDLAPEPYTAASPRQVLLARRD